MEISKTQSNPLPSAWIDRLFDRFMVMYGAKFAEQWRGVEPDRLKQAWAEDLAGFSASEIKAGLDICKQKPWPPTLPEFMTYCRPPVNPQTEWLEAIDQMRIRLQGNGMDKWSRPAVYWAAVAVGWHDLNESTWDKIKTRWQSAIESAKHDPIPEYRLALPEPGQATTTREEAACKIRAISEMLAAKKKAA